MAKGFDSPAVLQNHERNKMLAEPNVVAAYLYLHLGEQMPDDADEEWFLSPDPVARNFGKVPQFISETEQLLNDLDENTCNTSEEIMFFFYEAAKRTFDQDKTMIRTYFQWLYLIVLQRPDGPRWGDFVMVYGIEEFQNLVRYRFTDLIRYKYGSA